MRKYTHTVDDPNRIEQKKTLSSIKKSLKVNYNFVLYFDQMNEPVNSS